MSEDRDVHTEHCCIKHGCKYGEPDECTVCNGTKTQSYPCEYCLEDEEDNSSNTLIEEQAARIAELEKDRDEARALVAEANNSLYGSQGYFHSLNGGPFDKYHLANGIEELKSSSRRTHRAEARLSEAVKVLEPIRTVEMLSERASDEDIVLITIGTVRRIKAFIDTLGETK